MQRVREREKVSIKINSRNRQLFLLIQGRDDITDEKENETRKTNESYGSVISEMRSSDDYPLHYFVDFKIYRHHMLISFQL